MCVSELPRNSGFLFPQGLPCDPTKRRRGREGKGERQEEPRITRSGGRPKDTVVKGPFSLSYAHPALSPWSGLRCTGGPQKDPGIRQVGKAAERQSSGHPITRFMFAGSQITQKLHVHRGDTGHEGSWNEGPRNAVEADIQLRPTRAGGGGEEPRGSLLGREVGSRGHSCLGRGGRPEDGPGRPGAAVHTPLSAAPLGLRPSSPPAALSGLQGPGKDGKQA